MEKSQKTQVKPKRAFVEFVRYFSLSVSKIFFRIEYKNTENIPNDLEKGLIITPNHQTYFDPFWACVPVKKDMRYMTWDKAFQIFPLGTMLRAVGAFPMSLEKGGTIKALKDSLEFLRDDKALIIFPEGEREFADGELLEFKTGAIRLALEADVPILPVSICGGNRVWSRDHYFPRPRKIKIYYHPLFYASEFGDKNDLHSINESLKKIIASKT